MELVHRVVIVGGGFGGLNAAKALGHAPVEVNRVLVFIRWGFQYLTFDRGSRLISGDPK